MEPFQPRFKVKVSEPVKDGEAVMYTVNTVKVPAMNSCNVTVPFPWLILFAVERFVAEIHLHIYTA